MINLGIGQPYFNLIRFREITYISTFLEDNSNPVVLSLMFYCLDPSVQILLDYFYQDDGVVHVRNTILSL